MKQALLSFEQAVQEFREHGTYKEERIITTPQGGRIDTTAGRNVLNMCANNYLGLASSRALAEYAAKDAMDRWGYGLSSARALHLRHTGAPPPTGGKAFDPSSAWRIRFCILPASTPMEACSRRCWTNGMQIISDALNHASIIDGVSTCARQSVIATKTTIWRIWSAACATRRTRASGCPLPRTASSPWTASVANLKGICGLAEKYDALVMVDRRAMR